MFYMNIDNRLWGMRCNPLIYLNITNQAKKNIERILVHFQVKPKGHGKDYRKDFKLNCHLPHPLAVGNPSVPSPWGEG